MERGGIHTGLRGGHFQCVTDAQTDGSRPSPTTLHPQEKEPQHEREHSETAGSRLFIHARSNLHSPHTNVHFPVSRPVTDGFCLFSRHTEKQPRRAAAQCRSERALPPFCCFAPEDNSFHASACRSKSSSSENMSAWSTTHAFTFCTVRAICCSTRLNIPRAVVPCHVMTLCCI